MASVQVTVDKQSKTASLPAGEEVGVGLMKGPYIDQRWVSVEETIKDIMSERAMRPKEKRKYMLLQLKWHDPLSSEVSLLLDAIAALNVVLEAEKESVAHAEVTQEATTTEKRKEIATPEIDDTVNEPPCKMHKSVQTKEMNRQRVVFMRKVYASNRMSAEVKLKILMPIHNKCRNRPTFMELTLMVVNLIQDKNEPKEEELQEVVDVGEEQQEMVDGTASKFVSFHGTK